MIEFALTIPGTTDWYRVLIFPRVSQMHEFYHRQWTSGEVCDCRRMHKGKMDCQFLGQVSYIRPRPPDGSLGQIIFCAKAIGAGVVSHEMTHAAVFYLRNHRGMNISNSKNDERLAYLQGDLTRDFWNQWYAAKRKPAA